GREAFLAEVDNPPRQVLAAFALEDGDSDAWGYEPIRANGEHVGFVTSGGFGHRVQRSLVMGYVDRAALDAGNFEIPILGRSRSAELLKVPAYDPAGRLMRS